jgi:twitching motility protein PilT
MDVGEILREVVEMQASDLHLAVGLPPVVRVDGHLRNLDGYPELGATEARELVYSILNQDQRQKLETDWEVDLSYSLYGTARFRVNAFFHKGTLGAAFRLIPVNIKTIDDLALPKVLHTFCHKPRGFVLVTGPTGSGKSTTLAAIIDEINESRIPSSSYIATNAAWSTRERWGATPRVSRKRCAPRCGRTPTSSLSARCVTWRRFRSP